MNTSGTKTEEDEFLRHALIEAGQRAEVAADKTRLFSLCLEQFAPSPPASPDGPVYALFVPGRIEFLGKHTDYAGGRSLVAAVDLGFNMVVRSRHDSRVRLRDVRQHLDCEFDLAALPLARPHDWTVYPLTVARRVIENFPGALRGADISFYGDLPQASGMSSSSAFVIALFMALAAVNRLEEHPAYTAHIRCPEDLAGYLATHENGQSFGALAGEKGVGTFGGSEDHTAILCGRAGCLVQYRYCPVAYECTVPMPAGLTFVVAVSGVVADKNSPATQEKYNHKSSLAARLAELWRRGTGRAEAHLAAILATGEDAPERLIAIVRDSPPEPYDHEELITRLRQFAAENGEIVNGAGAALAAGDLATLGALVDRSQNMAQAWLGTQVPETAFLARSARELGAHAASSFGAGFGGSVWALVDAGDAGEFARDWLARYRAAYPEMAERAMCRTCHPGPAAFLFQVPAGGGAVDSRMINPVSTS